MLDHLFVKDCSCLQFWLVSTAAHPSFVTACNIDLCSALLFALHSPAPYLQLLRLLQQERQADQNPTEGMPLVPLVCALMTGFFSR